MIKRLGIFLLTIPYYKDSYITYMVKEFSQYVEDIVVICDIEKQIQELKQLEKYASSIIDGFNNMELQNVLDEKGLINYDQLLIWDDSIYGPFYSMTEVFKAFSRSLSDMFGISQIEKEGSAGEKLLTYFLILNNKAIQVARFKGYFSEINQGNGIEKLYNGLVEAGLTWSSYISIENKKNEKAVLAKPYNPNILYAYMLIKDFMCPFLKRECFEDDNLSLNSGEELRCAINYITEYCDYDETLIWKDLIKRKNILDLKNLLHLEYVLPWKAYGENKDVAEYNCAIIIHLYYEDLVDTCFTYIKEVPNSIDVYITTSSDGTKYKVKEAVEKYNLCNCILIDKDNRGRDISSLLVASREIALKYKYFCFVHDKNTLHISDRSVPRSYMYNIWENTLKSRAYIYNVLDCLEANKQLGLLCPPVVYHGYYMAFEEEDWKIQKNYKRIQALAGFLNITCNLDINKPAFTYGTAFWCKTDALLPLLKTSFSYTDFPEEPMPSNGTISHAIERIFGYVAQSQGYYTGVAMNTDYASLRGSNLNYMFNMAVSKMRQTSFIATFDDIKRCDEKIKAIVKFCNQCKEVYIYGAGKYGKGIAKLFLDKKIDFKGFIISDGEAVLSRELLGHRIYELSEINLSNQTGIILAMMETYQEEVKLELETRGFNRLFNPIYCN